MYKKTKLGNGLRIVTRSMPKMQSVAIGVWIKVGGRYESRENKGISHYLEHLLFKGTKKYSCRKIKESIEGVGGILNGFTSEEMTCYLVKVPLRYLDLGLDILSEMAINPLLPALEVEKERTVILEELKMYRDQPQSYVYDLLDELLWPEQALGMSVIGSQESINSIQREDLRLYQKKCYTPLNIVVSAAGVLENDKFVKRTDKIFSRLESDNINSFLPARQGQLKPGLNLLHKETEQSHLVLGFHSFKRDHRLKFAQGLLHVILGANMSSRLFNQVREKKGLAYEIGTQIKRFEDSGAFLVHAGIDNRKVSQALAVILTELEKIKRKPVSDDEFKRAKDFYLGQLELSLEDTMDNMLWIGESTTALDKIYTLEELVKEIKKVKKEEIAEAAEYIFDERKSNLAVIGPLKGQEAALEKQLKTWACL